MNELLQNPNAPQRRPDGPRRGVFVSERAWRVIATAAAVAFGLVAGGATAWWALTAHRAPSPAPAASTSTQVPSSATDGTPAAPAGPVAGRLIDGMPLAPGAAQPTRYVALTIDDLSVARPQSGISKASVVWEAPVEGGITRFLAVFPEDGSVDRIGPVRSARPYFIDWASEFDALFAHVGGSPEALQKIGDLGTRDLNEMSAGQYFWRDAVRKAPHNAYTSLDMVAKAEAARFGDHKDEPIVPWKFKADAPPTERPDKASLAIDYGNDDANVRWDYDPKTDDYARSQGGERQSDGDVAVRAKNIVVQYTQITTIDDIGRRRITTVGEGDALVAMDGNVVHGTWKKEGRTSRTLFLDASGNQLRFDAGTTWIEVVPDGTKVDF